MFQGLGLKGEGRIECRKKVYHWASLISKKKKKKKKKRIEYVFKKKRWGSFVADTCCGLDDVESSVLGEQCRGPLWRCRTSIHPTVCRVISLDPRSCECIQRISPDKQFRVRG